MKKKVLIYPYTDICIPFIEQIDLENSELFLVSPKGWNYDQEKWIYQEKCSVRIEFEKTCEECDEVWFVNSNFTLSEDGIISKLIYAQKNNKKIRFFRCATDKISKLLGIEEEKIKKDEIKKTLSVIHTPIVVVAGLFQESGGWETELALCKGKIINDYNVIQIGSKLEGEVLGMRKIPDFIYSLRYTVSEKILLLNQYIKNIEDKEHPDLIIIGIPGGIQIYSRDIPENFGTYATMVSEAVSPDIMILSLPFDTYSKESLEEIRQLVWGKYHIYINFFNVFNRKILPYDSESAHKILYMKIADNWIREAIKKIDIEDVYNVNEVKEKDRIQKDIITTLSVYGEINFV